MNRIVCPVYTTFRNRTAEHSCLSNLSTCLNPVDRWFGTELRRNFNLSTCLTSRTTGERGHIPAHVAALLSSLRVFGGRQVDRSGFTRSHAVRNLSTGFRQVRQVAALIPDRRGI